MSSTAQRGQARRGHAWARVLVASLLPLAALAACPGAAYAAPKTDVVVLRNGDRITGEVKALEHNLLRFSTDTMGTIYIEWDKIDSLQSGQYLLLESTDGKRYYGQLEPGGDAQLQVRRGPDSPEETVDMVYIVRAEPIVGGRVIDRLDGYVSAGLDVAKANDRRSIDFAGGLSSRTRVRSWSVDGSMNLTDDSGGETSERYQLQGTWRQFRRGRDFYQGFGGFERNSELDLNLRTLAGAGLGRYFVQTNRAEWLGVLGIAVSRENSTGGGTLDSLEAVLSTNFSIFRYDFPETDIGGTLSVLPSLTESGRYRAEADLRAKYEFIDDLYFELKVYGSYDSQPPLADSEQSDYGLTTSLGYSF
jgi:Protein of unknown function, DUF481